MSLESLLAPEEDNLDFISRRLFFVEAFAAELDRISHSKPCRIWNLTLWTMLLDTRDAHVIHLSSWLKSMYQPGGFFGQIVAHHLKELPRRWRRLSELEGSLEARLLESSHDKAFSELFPGAGRAFPSPADVNALKDRFVEMVKPVIDDRHNNRAHPFDGHDEVTSSARMLDTKDLREVTQYAQRVLNRIRLIATSSTFGYKGAGQAATDEFTKELVDGVLLGSRARIAHLMGDHPRDEYYESLHVRHDSRAHGDERLFNDVWHETA
jgi:hypothetical protein